METQTRCDAGSRGTAGAGISWSESTGAGRKDRRGGRTGGREDRRRGSTEQRGRDRRKDPAARRPAEAEGPPEPEELAAWKDRRRGSISTANTDDEGIVGLWKQGRLMPGS